MFSGIVQGRGRVVDREDHGGVRSLVVELPEGRGHGLAIGGSVSVAGVCLTAVEIQGDRVRFDCIDETLRRTTLGSVRVGDGVNIERAARFGDEIGGHYLSGHVFGIGRVLERVEVGENLALSIGLPPAMLRAVLPKGYVAVDGVSLTVGAVDGASFTVHLIPETRRVTTLGDRQAGDEVNIEIDAMTQAVVETVERIMAARPETALPRR